MSKTKISWADQVWNPTTGCSKISAGCLNCYAEKRVERLQKIQTTAYKYQNGFKVTTHNFELKRFFPGKKQIIFVNSMSDIFHNEIHFSFIFDVLTHITRYPQHTFVILTKRPERALKFFTWLQDSFYKNKCYKPLENLILGITAETQELFNQRVEILLQIPVAKRLVCMEPQLEAVSIAEYYQEEGAGCYSLFIDYIDWVICGCESGPGRRPFDMEWARILRDQCALAQVPFYFKQAPAGNKIETLPLLDGERWNQFPEVIHE